MDKQFAGKVALITGGTSGLGADAAMAFAREGANVVLAGRRIQAGEEIVAQIKQAGGEARFVRADVSQAADVEGMVQACIATYGGLDYAYNNAGIDGTLMVPLVDYKLEVWEQVIATNLTGTFLCMKHEIKAMLERGGGSIVNMSAVAGLKAGRRVGAAYNASKAGIIGLTKAGAIEYAERGIRINAVCPALIRTPMSDKTFLKDEAMTKRAISMHPIGRIGQPEEVSSLVLWLCSNAAAFVTGTAIPIDGGMLLL